MHRRQPLRLPGYQWIRHMTHALQALAKDNPQWHYLANAQLISPPSLPINNSQAPPTAAATIIDRAVSPAPPSLTPLSPLPDLSLDISFGCDLPDVDP